jgi:hypothetical protein
MQTYHGVGIVVHSCTIRSGKVGKNMGRRGYPFGRVTLDIPTLGSVRRPPDEYRLKSE